MKASPIADATLSDADPDLPAIIFEVITASP